MIVDIVYEMRRGWSDASAGERGHAVWALANDLLALGLVAATLVLFVASAGPTFPTGGWLTLIALSVLWLVSIVSIDPVVDRLVYDD